MKAEQIQNEVKFLRYEQYVEEFVFPRILRDHGEIAKSGKVDKEIRDQVEMIGRRSTLDHVPVMFTSETDAKNFELIYTGLAAEIKETLFTGKPQEIINDNDVEMFLMFKNGFAKIGDQLVQSNKIQNLSDPWVDGKIAYIPNPWVVAISTSKKIMTLKYLGASLQYAITMVPPTVREAYSVGEHMQQDLIQELGIEKYYSSHIVGELFNWYMLNYLGDFISKTAEIMKTGKMEEIPKDQKPLIGRVTDKGLELSHSQPKLDKSAFSIIII